MKTLVTDLLFPSKYSKWRISEISSFIVDRGADILVFKVDARARSRTFFKQGMRI